MRQKRFFIIILILVLSFFSLTGQENQQIKQRGENLKVSLMIIGPGDPLYVWWGHIGLIVEKISEEESYFYDFGNFSFEQDHFYRNFTMGRLYYLSIRTNTIPYLRYLGYFNRSVNIYELNLTGKEKLKLFSYLEEGIKPENRTYLYHHYEDNCSTRIRDALDFVLDGYIKEQSGQFALSYREQSNRFIFKFWGYILLNYLQGPQIDVPISNWDAQFLPTELEKTIENLKRSNGESLVRKKIIFQEGRSVSIPDKPFPHLGEAFLWGMVLFIITLVIRLSEKDWLYRFWRIFSVLLTALPSLLLFFMMFFTDHHVTRGNLNSLVTFPAMILVLIPAIAYYRKNNRKLFQYAWDVQIALVILSLLWQLLPGVSQDNGTIILFYLPLYLGLGTAGTVLIEKINILKGPFPWSQKLSS